MSPVVSVSMYNPGLVPASGPRLLLNGLLSHPIRNPSLDEGEGHRFDSQHFQLRWDTSPARPPDVACCHPTSHDFCQKEFLQLEIHFSFPMHEPSSLLQRLSWMFSSCCLWTFLCIENRSIIWHMWMEIMTTNLLIIETLRSLVPPKQGYWIHNNIE